MSIYYYNTYKIIIYKINDKIGLMYDKTRHMHYTIKLNKMNIHKKEEKPTAFHYTSKYIDHFNSSSDKINRKKYR